MRGLVAVVVRIHSGTGTTHGFLTTAYAGAGFEASKDAAALNVALVGTAWPVFGRQRQQGRSAQRRGLHLVAESAKRQTGLGS